MLVYQRVYIYMGGNYIYIWYQTVSGTTISIYVTTWLIAPIYMDSLYWYNYTYIYMGVYCGINVYIDVQNYGFPFGI